MDKELLEEEIGRLMIAANLTVAVAESCTGGLICHRLTNVPGSSGYLERGLVTYSNKSKMELLDVREETIATYGAVSEDCARAMATGVRFRAGTSIGLSVTGIAGPTGGSDAKPVGTVYMALADTNGARCWKHRFDGVRFEIKVQAAEQALTYLRDHVRERHV